MDYQVSTTRVSSQLLAAVRRRIRITEIARTWKPALDLVWQFLHSHKDLRTDGHNCFLYHHPSNREAPMDIDFGVQVTRPFANSGEVICTATPAGEVAMTTHIGSYAALGAAHNAIHAWRAAHGRTFGGYSWEIYGDWTNDEAKLETKVLYLLS